MHESGTYLAIVDEGRLAEVKRVLPKLGGKRFGSADEVVVAAINGSEDLDRLTRMTDRLLEASSWQDLLETP